jgi:hypothetical protein
MGGCGCSERANKKKKGLGWLGLGLGWLYCDLSATTVQMQSAVQSAPTI